MEGNEPAGGKSPDAEEVARGEPTLLIEVDRGRRSGAEDAEGRERAVEVVARVDVRSRMRARVEKRNLEGRELFLEKGKVGPGGNEGESSEERQQLAVVRRLLEESAKHRPLDRMDAGRVPRTGREMYPGLGAGEVDLTLRPGKTPERRDGRKRENRIAEGARADREDASAGVRW
jgi:hypothetical protein